VIVDIDMWSLIIHLQYLTCIVTSCNIR
jgi:hypothetical protein